MKYSVALALTLATTTPALLGPEALAQILPDTTLGNESSQVLPITLSNGSPAEQITGGAQRGQSLFHSFTTFNIDEGQEVNFASPQGISTILSRVTGNSKSQINGSLSVDGNADLFLINPNGILFGPKSVVFVRGSLIATTAEEILFENGLTFDTVNPQVPLLTIGTPIGLQFGQRSADIQSRGRLLSETGTLGLSARGVSITGGRDTFSAGFGSVAIASIGSDARALIQRDRRGYQFSFDPVSTPFEDIQIEGTNIASFGDRGGRIQLWGKEISISKGAQLIERTTGSGGSDGISIEAERLVLSDRANIGTTAIEGTTSGNTTINASSSVEVIGSSLLNGADAFILSQSGNILISTPYLRISNNAQVIISESLGQDRASSPELSREKGVCLC